MTGAPTRGTVARVKIFAVSGSLRPQSTVTALLRASAALAPDGWDIEVYPTLGALPHFDPAIDPDDAPEVVAAFRAKVEEADAFVVASPEYAAGMPGVLKNALEWIVGSGEVYDKPTAVLTASPNSGGAARSRAWIVETLTIMTADLREDAVLGIPMVRSVMEDGKVTDEPTRERLTRMWTALAAPAPDADGTPDTEAGWRV